MLPPLYVSVGHRQTFSRIPRHHGARLRSTAGPRFGIDPFLITAGASVALLGTVFGSMFTLLAREPYRKAKTRIEALSFNMQGHASIEALPQVVSQGTRTEKLTVIKIGEMTYRFIEISETAAQQQFFPVPHKAMRHYRLENTNGGEILELTDWLNPQDESGTGSQQNSHFFFDSYGFFQYKKPNKRLITQFRQLILQIQQFRDQWQAMTEKEKPLAVFSTHPRLLQPQEPGFVVEEAASSTAPQAEVAKTLNR